MRYAVGECPVHITPDDRLLLASSHYEHGWYIHWVDVDPENPAKYRDHGPVFYVDEKAPTGVIVGSAEGVVARWLVTPSDELKTHVAEALANVDNVHQLEHRPKDNCYYLSVAPVDHLKNTYYGVA